MSTGELQGTYEKFPSLTTFGSCNRRSELLHRFFHCTFIVPHSLCSFHCTVKILLVKCLLEGIRPGFKLFLNLEKGIEKTMIPEIIWNTIMIPGYGNFSQRSEPEIGSSPGFENHWHRWQLPVSPSSANDLLLIYREHPHLHFVQVNGKRCIKKSFVLLLYSSQFRVHSFLYFP